MGIVKLNMKFNIWLDIPSRYIKGFCIIVSAAVDIFSGHILSVYFPFGFCYFSSYGSNCCEKCLLKSLFFQNLAAICFLFWICVVFPLRIWVFDWSLLCLEVIYWCFCNTLEFVQIESVRCGFVLPLQTLKLVKAKHWN